MLALFGVDHAERNGHHYFRGLSAWPTSVQKAALAAHGDLYEWHDQGFATLRVRDGAICLQTVVNVPFGVAPLYSLTQQD